jgi:hypothetical protein
VTGYLPNVPVSAIRLFNSGGTKKLRVSTYGRGIWEFNLNATPDFTNVISDSPQTVFPTQNATFHGTLAVLNGYNNAINLTCTGTPPSTCTLNPTQVPAPGSGTYTVTAGGAVGNYSFNAHATDNTITHDAPITLHVVDFAVGTPGPISVHDGLTATGSFQVTASGSFAQSVTLSCSAGLPSGATCSFAPNPVNPTSANPANPTLTVDATGNPTPGTYTVTIQGTTTSPAATRTTTFQLTVTPPPDFTWTTNGTTTKTVLAGQSATYSFTGTPSGAATFAADVALSCGNTNPPLTTCSFDKQIKQGDAATTVTLTIATTGPNTGIVRPQRAEQRSPWLLLTLPIAGIVTVGIAGRRVSRHSAIAGLFVSLALLGLLVACGGGSSSPPPPPPVSVTVKPSTTVNLWPTVAGWPAQTQQFTATVNNSTNQTVTWAVTGGAANGSIDATGLYTAPATVPNPANVTVTATALADATKSGSGKVNIQTPTTLGTFTVTVTATEGSVSHSQPVTLTVH